MKTFIILILITIALALESQGIKIKGDKKVYTANKIPEREKSLSPPKLVRKNATTEKRSSTPDFTPRLVRKNSTTEKMSSTSDTPRLVERKKEIKETKKTAKENTKLNI